MDCIHYKVREDGRILSRAAYVVLGVTVEGYKDILSITVGAVSYTHLDVYKRQMLHLWMKQTVMFTKRGGSNGGNKD